MAIVTIIGAGMMGSALAFPARENGNEVRIVGTHLDREIIERVLKQINILNSTKHFRKESSSIKLKTWRKQLKAQI